MSTENTNDNRSVYIGTGTVLEGSINAPNEIIVNGTFLGDLRTNQLTVGKTGLVRGMAQANYVAVCGRVEQKLIANKNLHVDVSGSVKGEVLYYELEVSKGGQVEGKLHRLDG